MHARSAPNAMSRCLTTKRVGPFVWVVFASLAVSSCETTEDAGSYSTPWPTVPAAEFVATPEGGGMVTVDSEPTIAGVRVTVPAGAVSGTTRIVVGTAPDAPEMDLVELLAGAPRSTASLVDRALALGRAATDGSFYHPAVYPLAMLGAGLEPSGPAIALEPTGATFAVPVTIEIPLGLLGLDPGATAEDVAAFVTVPGDGGETTWEVVPTVGVDASHVRLELDHFSVLRFAQRQGWRLAGAVVAPFMTLPEVPLMTDRLVQRIVCSGIEPRLDASRIPWGPDLLNYLMNPVISDPESLNPFIRYWSMRGVPDDVQDQAGFDAKLREMGFVNGREPDLEAWLRSQPTGSVDVDELFLEAYELAGGDWYQAVLLCHNTLRGIKYGPGFGNRSDPTIQGPMAPLVSTGDPVGHRYHLFGMMLWGIAHGTNSSRNMPGNFHENLRWYSSNLTVYLEEAIVSGDILTDPYEAAFDMEGFRTGGEFVAKVFNQSLSQLRDSEFTLEPCGDLAVTVTADPTSAEVGEYVFFGSHVSGGQTPYLYRWSFGDGGSSVLSSDTHAWSAGGTYTVTLDVEDAQGAEGQASTTITIAEDAPPEEDWVVWYTDNVRCWDAPLPYVSPRSAFEADALACSYPGGGVDCSVPLVKTVWNEGFATAEAAQQWACSQFTSKAQHYWCGFHYFAGGQPFQAGTLGCDWNSLPDATTP